MQLHTMQHHLKLANIKDDASDVEIDHADDFMMLLGDDNDDDDDDDDEDGNDNDNDYDNDCDDDNNDNDDDYDDNDPHCKVG